MKFKTPLIIMTNHELPEYTELVKSIANREGFEVMPWTLFPPKGAIILVLSLETEVPSHFLPVLSSARFQECYRIIFNPFEYMGGTEEIKVGGSRTQGTSSGKIEGSGSGTILADFGKQKLLGKKSLHGDMNFNITGSHESTESSETQNYVDPRSMRFLTTRGLEWYFDEHVRSEKQLFMRMQRYAFVQEYGLWHDDPGDRDLIIHGAGGGLERFNYKQKPVSDDHRGGLFCFEEAKAAF